jgi:hypothetical protein
MIKTLPNRYPELGRLRLGEKSTDPKKPGKPLDNWRLTSPDKGLLMAMGGIYGIKGEIKPWEKGQFEVVIDSNEIDVMLPADPWSAYYELWTKAGCQRRCDGQTAMVPYKDPEGGGLDNVDCVCLSEGKMPGTGLDVCSPNGRLSVVMLDTPGVGVWLMTTSSINACMEIEAQVELLERTGTFPAYGKLAIEHRTVKKSWESFERKFNVPTLRLAGTLRNMVAGAAATPALPQVQGGQDEAQGDAF